jgi:hypothetical protein
MKFNENPSSGSRVYDADGRTDATKLIVVLRNFGKAPKSTFKEIGWEGGDWIYVAQDRTKWCNLANKITEIRFPENAGTFQLAEGLLASQDGLLSVQLNLLTPSGFFTFHQV